MTGAPELDREGATGQNPTSAGPRRTRAWPIVTCLLTLGLGGPGPLNAQGVYYEVPGPDEVVLRSEPSEAGRVDIFYPSDRVDEALPAVLFVLGYSDDATSLGPLMDIPHYRDWAKIVTSVGLAAVLYSVREPVGDLDGVAGFLVRRGSELGLDPTRIAIWSASGNVPTALAFTRRQGILKPRAVVLYYGLMPTPDGFQSELHETASQRSGFALPPHAPDDAYPTDLPFLVVRAALERSEVILASIDRFVDYARSQELDLRLRNHTTGRHSFDSLDDTEETRAVIAETLAFLSRHLDREHPAEATTSAAR